VVNKVFDTKYSRNLSREGNSLFMRPVISRGVSPSSARETSITALTPAKSMRGISRFISLNIVK